MRLAVITGAASGIGLALTQIYLEKGMTTIMVDRNQDKLIQEVACFKNKFKDQLFYFTCDITNIHEVTELAIWIKKEFGRIDWIYNNAGIIGKLGPVWDLNPEDIHQVMDVNLNGMINIIRAIAPMLFEQPFKSHIINMASLYALCSGSQLAAYSMSKHAILALSESLYFDLNRLNKPVSVSVVFPSFTNTSLLNDNTEYHSPFQTSLNKLLAHSRPALETAQQIIQEVEQKKFYILPDKEVKNYCTERTESIVLQESPHMNNIEQLLNALSKRLEPSLG